MNRILKRVRFKNSVGILGIDRVVICDSVDELGWDGEIVRIRKGRFTVEIPDGNVEHVVFEDEQQEKKTKKK